MKQPDPFKEEKLKRLQLSIYLLPMLGCVPALWTLYLCEGNREQQAISRLSIILGLGWLLAFSLLGVGATQTADVLSFRLLYFDALLTSGYFLVCLGLFVRLWQDKLIRLGRN